MNTSENSGWSSQLPPDADDVEAVTGEAAVATPQLKVLLVHGIGRQTDGSHLVESVEAIVDLLVESGCRVEVESASLVGGTVDGAPAHARVRVGGQQMWLFAEAHWADAFPTPSYRELLQWGFKVAPITAIVYAAGVVSSALRNWSQLKRPTGQSSGLASRLWALLLILSALVQIAVIPLLVPLLLGVMVLLLIVALIPLSVVRSGVLGIQRGLTGALGDCYVFSQLPVRRAAILTAVRQDLHWLRETPGDAPVVVIAHSQGAAVAHHLLLEEQQRVSLLLTYGSGLERLSLTRLALTIGWQPTGNSLLALLGVVTMAWFTPGLVKSIAANPTAWAACLGILLGAMVAALVLQGPDKPASLRQPRAILAQLVACLGTGATFTWAWVLYPDIPMWWMGGLALISALIWAAKLAEADEHVTPDEVDRWVDLQADADPVATAEARRTEGNRAREVVRFTLTGSMLRDHVSYWRHPDVFTWRVVEELDKTAPGIAGGLALPLAERGRRASGIRTLLVCTRIFALWGILGVTAVVVAVRREWFDPDARTWSDELISTVSDIVAFPEFAEQYAGSILTGMVVAGSFILTYQMVLVPWRCWNWAHLRMFHKGGKAEWMTPAALLVVVLTVAAAGIGLGIAVFPAGDVADVAGQATPLLWVGLEYALLVNVVVGLIRSKDKEDAWVRVRRRGAWGLLVTAAAWTVTYLVLLPVLALTDPRQRLDHFEQRKSIILLVVAGALFVWLAASLVRKSRRRRSASGLLQTPDPAAPVLATPSPPSQPIAG